MKEERVQLRINKPGKHLIPEGYMRQGQVFWASMSNADQYINKLKIAELAVGPSEAKPAGPSEKKLSETGPDSLSTDSLRSSESGTVSRSSASAADPLSPPDRLSEPKKRGRPKKSAL